MISVEKKIAILLPSLKFGGGERVSLNLAKEIKGLGIAIDILVMSKEGEFLAEAEKEFAVHDLQCNKTYKLPYLLLQYLIRNRPNALISSFWKLNICACLSRLFFPFFKLLLWEHSPPSRTSLSPTWLYALSASLLYQLATKIVSVSDGVREDIRQCTVGLSRKLLRIYNPIFPPTSFISKRHVNEIPKVISVGRLELEKNPQLLIEAFALLSEKTEAELLIVGDGSLREYLERLCVTLHIEKKVRFIGFVKNPYEFLINSDLYVMTSTYEGFGNTIAEALYCGLPVVSTDCPVGPRELLEGGMYGTLVPLNDPIALAKAMENELKNRRSPEVQQLAALRFLPETVAKQFLDLIK